MAVFEGSFANTQDLRFAIVIGRFNDLVTEKLLAGCQDCLKRHGVEADPQGQQVDYAWVPGCFEIPLVARRLALTGRYDAIICLGAVIRGQTPHFDYVSAEVTKGVAANGLQTGVPTIMGVLTVDTMQQALERAGIKSNLGWSYAMNALEMASLMKQMGPPYGMSSSAQALPEQTILDASSTLTAAGASTNSPARGVVEG